MLLLYPLIYDETVVKEIDRIQVKRAMQNVIANAIKFSYPNSTIKISSKVENGHNPKDIDERIGIIERFQDDVFKIFTPAGRVGTIA
jgi:light-regulated signal transduction histidine kinase (bacteriophytochrome)